MYFVVHLMIAICCKLVSSNCLATAAGGCEFGLFVMVALG